MRIATLILLASVAGGCTSVKIVQRDGCWVKRTEKIFGRVIEDLGPCRRAEPQWAEDRVTRLVQECVAQADYRWSVRANEAWAKGAPYPAQPPQQELLRTCMEEARIRARAGDRGAEGPPLRGHRRSRLAARRCGAGSREAPREPREDRGVARPGRPEAGGDGDGDRDVDERREGLQRDRRDPRGGARAACARWASGVPGVRRGPRGADRRGPGRPDPDSSTAPASAPAAAPASPPSPAPRDTPKRERSSQLRARTPLARTPAVRAAPSSIRPRRPRRPATPPRPRALRRGSRPQVERRRGARPRRRPVWGRRRRRSPGPVRSSARASASTWASRSTRPLR